MTEQRQCPRCKGLVSLDAPEGLCPECLYLQAMESPAEGQPPNGEKRSPSPVFVPPSVSDLARHFPQLEILQLVGQGGMGAVYKARQPKLDRLLALKILPPEVAKDPTFAERFTREARSMARLNHPNIVTIFDFGEADGLFYFSMEFVDGNNVRELMESGALTPPLALQIIPQVCDALRYAHDEGVVHRDIKPENILLDKKGRVKIADFGLAKIVGLSPAYLTLTGTHEVMGTLYYMAPEQMKRSHSVDHRADLYSLGVVFYEMLTGELPLGRFAPPSHKARVDGRLDSIVLRALSREPEHRYQDAAELKKDVEGIAAAEPGKQARGETPGAVPPGFFDAIGNWARGFQAATPPPQVKPNWPSVRFSIPELTVWGAKATGEIYRNDEALIVEFQRQRWGGLSWTELKEVRIPISDIMSISCQTESWPHNPHLPKWMKSWGGTTQIVIKTLHPNILTELPVSKKIGRGRFVVDWGDRDAAQQLVDSIVRPSFQPQAGLAGRNDSPRMLEPAIPSSQIRAQVVLPATGLLLTGIVGLVSSLVFFIGMATTGKEINDFFSMLAIPGSLAGLIVITGALRMLKLQSHSLVLLAVALALLPWSPGWVLGLPFGIWALIVLRRPEIMAAFAGDQPRLGMSLPRAPEPPGSASPRRGRLGNFFRSVGRYCFTAFSGRQAVPHSAGNAMDSKDKVKVPDTVDYTDTPAKQ